MGLWPSAYRGREVGLDRRQASNVPDDNCPSNLVMKALVVIVPERPQVVEQRGDVQKHDADNSERTLLTRPIDFGITAATLCFLARSRS